MSDESRSSWLERMKVLFIGRALNPRDKSVFHQLSLVAFFAWVGLGADGLSSTCYGPSEAYHALAAYPHLSLFVALATALTIWILSASEAQVMEMFPSGGGGYVVASKLLNPKLGMVAGCALLVDYVLTIAISIASGADAIFSSLPPAAQPFKLVVAVLGIVILTVLNLRGVKESVIPLVPIFMLFLLTHAFAILWALISHAPRFGEVAGGVVRDVGAASGSVGVLGMLMIIVRAYGMGAGTYTGIEAVTSSMSILREPRVATAKRTLRYMAVSLAVMATGLFVAYLLYEVKPVPNKTLNAVLLESITAAWRSDLGRGFVIVTLLAETAILFIAAQAGFLSGPRILASMALDRWVPTRFASLSDRLVTHNGVILMSGFALVTLVLTGGSVHLLVVLYSINVFITLGLSQLGMIRHAWSERDTADAKRRLRVNLTAVALTLSILTAMIVLKFHEGGWITLLVTGTLIGVVTSFKRYYNRTGEKLKRLDTLVEAAGVETEITPAAPSPPAYDPKAKTAIVMVGGFNGLGLHTLFAIRRLFGDTFKNYVFIQVGLMDAGNFKGTSEIEHLQRHTDDQVTRYVDFMRRHGHFAEGISRVSLDALDEICTLAPDLVKQYPNAVFFGGQLAFRDNVIYGRWLHNYLVFAVQTRLHNMGIPFVILPIRV